MISLAAALKAEVLPMMGLLGHSLGRPIRLRCLEDNTQCLQAAETGYSGVLRHLPRTQRISVGVVHETFSEKSDQHELIYQGTSSHKGDMFTKRLDPNAFERVLTLINLVRPDGSKYKADWAATSRALPRARRVSMRSRPARPRAPRPPWTRSLLSTSTSLSIPTCPTTSTSPSSSSSDHSGCDRLLPLGNFSDFRGVSLLVVRALCILTRWVESCEILSTLFGWRDGRTSVQRYALWRGSGILAAERLCRVPGWY